MGEILVTCIDELVHPGYHSIYSRPPQTDRIHIVLAGRWDQRVQQRAGEEFTGLFLYFSPLPITDLEAAINYSKDLGHPLKNEDVQRIIKYRNLLQERFFYFGLEQEKEINFLEVIQSRGFRIDPTVCRVFVFGEYGGLCTRDIGAISRDQLALVPKSVLFLPSLSRSKRYAFQALKAA